MRISRAAAFAVCVTSAAAIGGAAEAATVSFFYAGAPYSYFLDIDDPGRPLFTTAAIVFDSGGETPESFLPNRSFFGDFDFAAGSVALPEGIVSIDFGRNPIGQFFNFDLGFDSGARLTSYSFSTPDPFPEFSRGVFISDGGELSTLGGSDIFRAGEAMTDILVDLGYKPGTSAFEALFDEFVGSIDVDFAAGPGEWFDDPLAFAGRIEANTRFALANPPGSINSIAPIPIPAPAGLLLIGLAGLAFVRRAARRGSARAG